jgi:hypothetical protein
MARKKKTYIPKLDRDKYTLIAIKIEDKEKLSLHAMKNEDFADTISRIINAYELALEHVIIHEST